MASSDAPNTIGTYWPTTDPRVTAYQTVNAQLVTTTADGQITTNPNDWIVTDGSGNSSRMSDAAFRAAYVASLPQ